MQIKIFNIPIGADDALVEEMNHFLRANKIIDIKKELAMLDGNSCWTFCVTYMLSNRPMETDNTKPANTKVDYKTVLDAATFEKFSALRKVRKMIAESEAIPAFAVFTDAELSEMAKLPVLTSDVMLKIPGIGKKKVEKYGDTFINSQTVLVNETSGTSDRADNLS